MLHLLNPARVIWFWDKGTFVDPNWSTWLCASVTSNPSPCWHMKAEQAQEEVSIWSALLLLIPPPLCTWSILLSISFLSYPLDIPPSSAQSYLMWWIPVYYIAAWTSCSLLFVSTFLHCCICDCRKHVMMKEHTFLMAKYALSFGLSHVYHKLNFFMLLRFACIVCIQIRSWLHVQLSKQ